MSVNQECHSEDTNNEPSDKEDSSNTSSHEDTSDDDSTDDELKYELLVDITREDFALVMNGSSVESHRAKLVLTLMLLIMPNGKDTRRQRYYDCLFIGLMRVQYYLNGHYKDMHAYSCMNPESCMHLCDILRDRGLLSDTQYMIVA